MSGSIGANRIPSSAVKKTVDSFIEKVLKKYPTFKSAKITGSYNVIPKDENGEVVGGQEKPEGHGDIDLVIELEGSREDMKKIKADFAAYLNSLSDDVTVPFRAGRHTGKKTAGTGDIVITQYHIEGFPDLTVQIDNMIVSSEEESTYRASFLDIPGPKQALMIGLAKTMCIEEDPFEIFKRLGIKEVPQLQEGQEYEFVLSSKGLTLRVVTLDNFKEVERRDIWMSYNWSDVQTLFKDYKVDGTFEQLLDQLVKKQWKSQRSKNRIKGTFKSMLVIGAGEVGTPKGAGKEAALDKVNSLLENEGQPKTVAIYAGGFKPPHRAHFENAKILGSKADKLVIFIGPKVREGVKITAEQSKAIWEIYAKYLPKPTEVIISEKTPILDTYLWIDQNQDSVDKIITGTTADEMQKFAGIEKQKAKGNYNNVEVVELPMITTKEDDKFSASEIRSSESYLTSGKWIPSEISQQDKQAIIDIVTPKSIEEVMLETIDEVLANLFPKKQAKVVREASSGTPVSALATVRSADRATLAHLYEQLRQIIPSDEFDVIFQQDRIYIYNKQKDQVGFDYTPYQKHLGESAEGKFDYTSHIASILEYMMDQGVKITPLPDIVTKEDPEQANDFFGKTAYYSPSELKVVLYTLGRHPKDVCRSFAHEMIHHKQNLQGRLENIQTTNINEDEYLKEIEREAYLEGNEYFRGWEDSVKNSASKKKVMAEGRYDKISNQVSSDIFRGWKQAYEKGKKRIKLEGSYSNNDIEFDVEATLVLKPGTGKMEVLDSTGAGFDEAADFIIANIAIDPKLLPEFWEEISMTLKDIFRHEIEHLTHNRGGFSTNPVKVMQGDSRRRDRIKAGEIPVNKYFKLKKEIDANLQGLLFRAKKEKAPFADVVNNYLDAQDITPKEKQEILTLWRNRMPALGIRQTL